MVKAFVVAFAAALSLVAASVGRADTINTYFGPAYMSWMAPTGACAGTGTGIACDGFNNWDRNRVYKSDGGYISIGFDDSSYNGYFAGGPYITNTTYVILRTDAGAPTYNRTFCNYYSGSGSYIQCQSILFG